MNEMERRAMEEERRSYARYRFLRGFRVSLWGVVYGLEWVTVRLPVLYRGGARVRTGVEELLMEERLVLRALLLPVLGTPSSKPRSWRWGDFK